MMTWAISTRWVCRRRLDVRRRGLYDGALARPTARGIAHGGDAPVADDPSPLNAAPGTPLQTPLTKRSEVFTEQPDHEPAQPWQSAEGLPREEIVLAESKAAPVAVARCTSSARCSAAIRMGSPELFVYRETAIADDVHRATATGAAL